MNRKIDNEADIQTTACRWSRIMMRLGIVRSATNKAVKEDDEDNIHLGTKVMKEIVLPWDKMDRIIFTDSHFASVPSAE